MRIIYLAIGVAVYFVFFITFVALIAFIGNLPMYFDWLMQIMPKSIDSVPGELSLSAIVINLSFIVLFAVQHTIMARPKFKQALTRFFPAPLERSLFVLMASLILIAMMVYWQPMTTVVWQVDNMIGQTILWTIFALGWVILLFSSFLINHFDLFGLRQTFLAFQNKPYEDLPFQIRSIYKLVRHPLYLGFILGMWSTPMMSAGHLLLALGFTAYIYIGVRFEERDLVAHFGDKYKDYQKSTPKIIPFIHK